MRFSSPGLARYYHRLPVGVQEELRRSGLQFSSEEQLRAAVSRLVQTHSVY